MADIPPGLNVYETNQSVLYAATFATFSLACVAVSVRFGSRWLTKAGRWFDDWFALAALVMSFLLVIDMYFWIRAGFGKHYELYGPSVYPGFFKGLMWMDIAYAGIMVATKFSMLALYARVFDRPNMYQPMALLALFLTGWLVAAIITATMQCTPGDNHCSIASRGFPLGIWVPNMLTNAAIIVLPVRYIDRSALNGVQRTMLACIFGGGLAVCAVSLIRLFILFAQDPAEKDFTWELVPFGVWTLLECNLAIMAACLPAFRPIWDLVNSRREAPCAPDAVSEVPSKTRPLWMPHTPPETPMGDETDHRLLRHNSLDNPDKFDLESARTSSDIWDDRS